MSSPTSGKLTRRGFLRYSGATAGALAFLGVLERPADAFPPLEPDVAELSPRQKATLGAIVVALGSSVPEIDAARANEVVAEVGRRYRAGTDESRRSVDLALGTVELGMQPGEFASQPARDRLATLRAGMSGRADRNRGISAHTNQMRSILVANAVALAANPFFSGENEWRRERFPF